jgi:hypothetical protein
MLCLLHNPRPCLAAADRGHVQVMVTQHTGDHGPATRVETRVGVQFAVRPSLATRPCGTSAAGSAVFQLGHVSVGNIHVAPQMGT